MKKINKEKKVNKEKMAPTKKEEKVEKEPEQLKVSHKEIELSDDDKAKEIFSKHPLALNRYRHVRKFSVLKHTDAINFVKRILKIK